MDLTIQKVRIDKVETHVNLTKKIFYVTLHLLCQDKNYCKEVKFYEGDTIYSLYQILELYFGPERWIIDVTKLCGKEMRIILGRNCTDIAFSTPCSGRISKWVVLGNYDKLYTRYEAEQILKSRYK